MSALALLAASGCGRADEPPAPQGAGTAEAEAAHAAPRRVDGAVYSPGTEFIVGYADTPYLPGGRWRVHDAERPRPEIVRPKTGVFTPPPSDAIVLFDGADLSAWRLMYEGAAEWVVENGAMRVPSGEQGRPPAEIETRQAFGDIQLHLEWRTPSTVVSGSQGRGNSGVFLMGRYEVQVLDSYENPTYADGQASALYGWKPPLKNASLPPGEWQSYDIVFEAPRFGEDGSVRSPAYVTVLHNGVLTHNREAFLGLSTHRQILPYAAHEPRAPLRLQDHGDPVEFRNIWVRELDLNANN